ncbi:MAG TPA: ThiF family adenylyltransferase [Solirubrobacterales bacterium]|nr:ThiF family adenylyltransferase [Solirubrobacterales bacterium]
MNGERYVRHLGLFGAKGQEQIATARVAIIGLGGLGSHLAQQLAYLGVREFQLLDGDMVEETNLNRLIGAGPADIGRAKIEITERELHRIVPEAAISAWPTHFDAAQPPLGLEEVDILFGCVDEDPVRLSLVSFTSRNRIPYLDLASDVTEEGEFGGRIVFARDGERCLSCLGELDHHALARAQMSDSQRAADDKIYGVDRAALDSSGPSVVSVNGAVASLAVTEFMVWVTGLREPRGYITYRGDLPSVGVRNDCERGYCRYCMDLWGNPAT